jgi:hypothetical protein
MSKEKSNCFELNPKQKKLYEKWKRFIENLSRDNINKSRKESKNKLKYKPKNFENYFPVDTITKYYVVNRLDYEPILGA